MNILISGIFGFMGREVKALSDKGYRNSVTVAGVDINVSPESYSFPVVTDFNKLPPETIKKTQVIVDFSHHSVTKALTGFAVKNGIPLVIATTGQTAEENEIIINAAKSIPVFFASNFSMGIALLIELAKKAALSMPDAEIEIVEAHHDRKLDAPSGTALTIAKALQEVRPLATINAGRSGIKKREPEEIGISSIRMGNIVGMHEVMLGTNNQTITLKHEAHSRALFAEGALAAAEYIINKAPGLYDMKSLIAD